MKTILALFSNIYNNRKLLLISIFLISLLFSAIFLIFFKDIGPLEHHTPGTDYLVFYRPIAQNIFEGKGITLDGKLAVSGPPGYSFILSGIFAISRLTGIHQLQLVVIFNIIIAAISCIFLFLIAELIFNKKIALIASFLWMSYPFNLWFIKNPNTEVPFILFLYIGIWLFILTLKKRQVKLAFLTGTFFSLASLTRPIGLFLPFFLVLLLFPLLKEFPKRMRFLLAVGLLLGSLITILPWEGYVFFKTGQIIPLAAGGSGSVRGGLVFALKAGKIEAVPADVQALMERAQVAGLDSEAKIFQFCFYELINRPLPFLKLIGMKIVRAWYATSSMWWEGKILAVQILYLLTGLAGIILAIRVFRYRIQNIIFLLSIVLCFWGMTVIALSILRYMIPVMGVVIIFSAVSIELVITTLFKKFTLCRLKST